MFITSDPKRQPSLIEINAKHAQVQAEHHDDMVALRLAVDAAVNKVLPSSKGADTPPDPDAAAKLEAVVAKAKEAEKAKTKPKASA